MSKEILINEQKIKDMKRKHTLMLAKIAKIKDTDKYIEECGKATAYLNDINDLRTKTNNLRAGRPANGYSDGFDDFKIIE
jgi:hypothetical protein